MPVRCPTMVCFGGADMKTLYITTTRENMDADEVAKFRRHLHPAGCGGRDEEIAVYRTLNRIDRHHVFAGIAAQHFHGTGDLGQLF
jgi:hypothetical protein